MELDIFLKGVSSVGFPIMLVGTLMLYIDRRDKQNREDTNVQIKDLKSDIKELRLENKLDKEMFSRAIDCFNTSVTEFKSVNSKITGMEKDIDKIKDDMTEVKSKI